ncbi:MAG: aminoglycoside phosphotransferase family protein, partial [Afipia sp.]
DPKHLIGDRAFDYANIFTNPDLDHPQWPVATIPERFARRLEIVTDAAKIERTRMLRWILAWTGLSAVWYLDDGDPAEVDLRVAEFASAELNR